MTPQPLELHCLELYEGWKAVNLIYHSVSIACFSFDGTMYRAIDVEDVVSPGMLTDAGKLPEIDNPKL